MIKETVYIASDHAGFSAKEKIKEILNSQNITLKDFGPNNETKSYDYPDYAQKVAKAIQKNPQSKGILICGSGTGMQIAANKFKGIRAAFAYDTYSAQMARKGNDANILTLRSRNFDPNQYQEIITTFLKTPFSQMERHCKRIEKIKKIEINENEK